MKRNDKGEGDHTLYLQPLWVCRYSIRGVGRQRSVAGRGRLDGEMGG